MTIRLSWTDINTTTDRLDIYRSDAPMDADNLPEPLGTVGSGVNAYDDGDVVAGQQYFYRVAAFRGDDYAVSDELSVTATPEVLRLIFPLTYDELDSEDAVALARSGGAGPHVTPEGFEGDGYSARYLCDALPSFVNMNAPLLLACSARLPLTRPGSSREEIVSLCTNDANARARLGLSVVADARAAVAGAVAVQSFTGTDQQQVIGRPGWRYEFRTPEVEVRGFTAKPQGCLFLDPGTVLFSIHADNTESIVYKVRLSDGALLGRFSFGLSTHRHVAAFARQSNGDVWAGDYETGALLRVDLDASFSTGSAQITKSLDCSAVVGFGAIEFVALAGTEYLLAGEYYASSDAGFLYLFDVNKLSGAALLASDRYRRYVIGRRIQGIAIRSGSLIVARNVLHGSSLIAGYIQQFNLAGIVLSLPDGATISSSANATYITGEWFGPAAYVEDVAIHPVTNDVFTPTEGAYGVADFVGFLGLWSSNLSFEGVTNHYAIDFDGANTVTVKINNQVWGSMPWVPGVSADVLSIGGLPTAVAGFDKGFTWGVVSNVCIQNKPLSSARYEALLAGYFEDGVLSRYDFTLTNPGAEAGDASGWTNEIGGLAVRAALPPPYSGAWYFTGGNFLQTLSRQRRSMSSASVPVADIDAGTSWAKIRWKQSAYSPQDPGTVGLRLLNASNTALVTSQPPAEWTLGGGGASGPWFWFPRSHPVAIPAGVRSLDALYNAAGRTSGTANDFYVDDIRLTVYVP